MLRRSLVVAIVAASAIAGACGGKDNPTGPGNTGGGTDTTGHGGTDTTTHSDSAAGTFTLTTINALALPVTTNSDTGYTLEVTAGTALLQANGTFIMSITQRETVAGYASIYIDSTSGTWTQHAGTVNFAVPSSGSTTSATWAASKLTIVQDGIPYVYTKH